MKTEIRKTWNRVDLFLGLFIIVAVLSFYFTVVHPIAFSNKIDREDTSHYAEMELLLPNDLSWVTHVFPVGEESKNVYGQLEWKILGFGEEKLGENRFAKVKVKALVTKTRSGILQYQSNELRKGNFIYLLNHDFILQGYVLNVHLLEEKVAF